MVTSGSGGAITIDPGFVINGPIGFSAAVNSDFVNGVSSSLSVQLSVNPFTLDQTHSNARAVLSNFNTFNINHIDVDSENADFLSHYFKLAVNSATLREQNAIELSPQGYSAFRLSHFEVFSTMHNQIGNRTALLRTFDREPKGHKYGWDFWANINTSATHTRNSDFNFGYRNQFHNVAAGADTRLGDFVVGGALGFTYSDLHSYHNVDGDAYHFMGGLYGEFQQDPTFAELSVLGSYARANLDREINFFDTGHKFSADMDSYGVSAKLKFGFNWQLPDNVYMRPQVALEGTFQHIDSFNEKGSSLKLDVNSIDSTAALLSIGAKVGGMYPFENEVTIHPYFYAGYQEDLVKLHGNSIKLKFAPSAEEFIVQGEGIRREALKLDAGLETTFGKRWESLSPVMYGRYESEIRAGSSHKKSLSLGLKVSM